MHRELLFSVTKVQAADNCHSVRSDAFFRKETRRAASGLLLYTTPAGPLPPDHRTRAARRGLERRLQVLDLRVDADELFIKLA